MIFCVEDDRDMLQMMLYTLNASGFRAKGFENGMDFWKAMETEMPKLVMLDIMLPGEDGLMILKKLRSNSKTKDIYIIMTTAKGSEYDKVIGLDSGADFYLAKPFGMLEMVAHVKAVLRRGKKIIDTKVLSIGKIKIDTARHTVFADGKEVVLTYKEYEILKMLMENPGVVYSRDTLLEKIWGYDYIGETRAVDVHVGALRMKLGECGEYIETVRGLGYKMEDRE